MKNLKFKMFNSSKTRGKNSKLNEGFTLIELLTVISIIGILTALLTVSFISVRQRGRDAQRKSNIKQIQSALELYRADNDQYPAASTFSTCGGAFSSAGTTYMSQIPCDPSSGGVYYYYLSSPTAYVVASCMENTNDRDAVAAANKPAYWPSAAAWVPTTTCSSGYYYVSQNP